MNKILTLLTKNTKANLLVKPTENTYFINGKNITIKAVTFDELLEVVFLFIPYIKAIKNIQTEYKAESDMFEFFDIVKNILEKMRYQDLNRCLQILLHETEESVKDLTAGDVIKILPIIIKENDLISVYFAMRNLGMFE